jgi:hypothetical protein
MIRCGKTKTQLNENSSERTSPKQCAHNPIRTTGISVHSPETARSTLAILHVAQHTPKTTHTQRKHSRSPPAPTASRWTRPRVWIFRTVAFPDDPLDHLERPLQ